MNKVTMGWLVSVILLLLAVGSLATALHYRETVASYKLRYEEMQQAVETGTRSEVRSAREQVTARPEPGPDRDRARQLNRRIEELEHALVQREQELETLRARRMVLPDPDAIPDEEPPRRDRRDRMEALRESDPERYAELMERREERRRRVQDAFARQAAHFLYRDRDSLSPAEREEYDYMLGLLGETWQLSDRLQAGDLPPEERHEAGRQLFENARALRPLLAEQRDREFFEMGLQLGYDERGAAEFVDYINNMIEITSMSSMWGGRPGGRRGPDTGRGSP